MNRCITTLWAQLSPTTILIIAALTLACDKRDQKGEPLPRVEWLRAISANRLFVRLGEPSTTPLAVGLAAVTNQRVTFTVTSAPDDGELAFADGETTSTTVSLDSHGQASTGFTISSAPGVYWVRAHLVDMDRADRGIFFQIITEGVVTGYRYKPTGPILAGVPFSLTLKPRDWLGAAVPGLALCASLDDPYTWAAFTVTEREPGTYLLRSNITKAGSHRIWPHHSPGFAATEPLEIDVLPGPPAELDIHRVEHPRERPPYNQAGIHVRARDRFGNLIPELELEWTASSGRIAAVPRAQDSSASASLSFADQPQVTVTAGRADLSGSRRIELRNVVLQPLMDEDFVYQGRVFGVGVTLFPPSGGGTLNGLELTLDLPDAEAAHFLGSTPGSGFTGLSERRDPAGNQLLFTLTDAAVSLNEKGEPLRLVDLRFRCRSAEPACVRIRDGRMAVSRSPQVDHELRPGDEFCMDQKHDRELQVCLQFHIVAHTRDRLGNRIEFDAVRDRAREYVAEAQKIFDQNVASCCPRLSLRACFRRVSLRGYFYIIDLHERNGVLDAFIYSERGVPTPNPDPTKDAWTLTEEMRQLLNYPGLNCINVFLAPYYRAKIGGVWRNRIAETISPRDFPESLNNKAFRPTILMSITSMMQDPKKTILAHELGHLFIDLPRTNNDGDEHANDPTKLMHNPAFSPRDNYRGALTATECDRILGNILHPEGWSRYAGNCN